MVFHVWHVPYAASRMFRNISLSGEMVSSEVGLLEVRQDRPAPNFKSLHEPGQVSRDEEAEETLPESGHNFLRPTCASFAGRSPKKCDESNAGSSARTVKSSGLTTFRYASQYKARSGHGNALAITATARRQQQCCSNRLAEGQFKAHGAATQ